MTGTNSLPPANASANWRSFVFVSGLLVLCFSLPLYRLVRFAVGSELYSHVILIPFVSAYLVWLKRSQLTSTEPRLSPAWAIAVGSAGCVVLAGYIRLLTLTTQTAPQNILALAIYSLILLFAGACCWFLNLSTLRASAFPLGFLVFMAPFPVGLEAGLESFLQHASAPVADAFFKIIGTPVYRDGTFFHLPGFQMQIAPECSGIHSTVALFITSLVAGQVLLRSTWSRTVLAVAVLPLALLRNGFRVTTIGELCVRIGPEMIDSYIHRHGGPIFFAISLVPFSVLLLILLKTDRRREFPVKSVS